MPRLNYAYRYAGTDGKLCKIGVSDDPEKRAKTLGIRVLKLWKRPYALAIETGVKGQLAFNVVRETEWFDVSPEHLLRIAARCVRIEDDWRAIELGLEPRRRPGPGDPEFEPPFELEWADRAAGLRHWSENIKIGQHWRRNPKGVSPRFVRVSKPT